MKTRDELLRLKRNELFSIAREAGIKASAISKKEDLVTQILDSYLSKNKKFSVSVSSNIKNSDCPSLTLEVKGKDKPLLVIKKNIPTGVSKSNVSPIAKKSEEKSGELPRGYNQTKIVLMVRDPFWAYTYWDIDATQEAKLKRMFQTDPSVKTVLRIHDVTDIEFNGFNSHRFWDVDVHLDARNWYVNLSIPNRAYIVDLGLRDSKGQFYLIARSNRVLAPRSGPSDVTDEKWHIADFDFDELYAASGGFGIGISSGEIKKKKKLFEIPEWLTSGMVSSPGVAPANEGKKEKDFFLQVATELILYGRTKPDAKLTVEGKQIPLRPDGTFSLRFFLPDGYRSLPVVAVAKEGDDTRKITVEVEKDTF